jgi:fructan beta-fructosidase
MHFGSSRVQFCRYWKPNLTLSKAVFSLLLVSGYVGVRTASIDVSHQSSPAMKPLYDEPLRPQFHFTARQWTSHRLNPVEHQEGWVNDLNGLIYYDGEYHLFAQRWATCWIHAVSRDLIHWTELEPAFWEETEVDYHNTSGLSSDPSKPPMVAFWSRFDNRSQCICYSLDHGRTWTRYAKNPIMDHPERDPKVFWYAPGKHWVMMLYGNGQYQLLTSTNLLDWKDEHHPIKDSFECPDFFELPLDGDRNRKKWVLIQGNGNYSIGTFDGVEFHEESGRRPCDIGPNFYATQTWANTDTGDGRRIQVAWMRGSVFPNMPFNQQISFPCELTLRSTPEGPRVFREPIRGIRSLHEKESKWSNHTLAAGESLSLATSGELFHLRAEVRIAPGAKLTFSLRGVPVTFTERAVTSGDASGQADDEIHTVEILLDRGSIETFVNHGEISSTRFALPSGQGLEVSAEGGPVTIKSLSVFPLKSAWGGD